jgi:3-oxoacyl-[acyl-carrier protein] reductase
MDLGLKNKGVIVTAASKGLGKASAKEFAAEGANVLICSRNEEELKKAVAEIKAETGADVHYAVFDVTKPESIKAMVDKAASVLPTIDVLVNNAGGPPGGSFDDFNDEAWISAFQLNLLSVVRLTREVLPYFRKQGGGRIVTITSSSIKQPIAGLLLSNVFRTGVLGLSKSLSAELAPDNILINIVAPGRIGTERVAELDENAANKTGKSVEQVKAASIAQIPLGRYGQPQEFGKMVAFLGSFANTYVTGQALLVDGGMVKAL